MPVDEDSGAMGIGVEFVSSMAKIFPCFDNQ